MNWITERADLEGLRKADLEAIGYGRVIAFSRQKRLYVDTSQREYSRIKCSGLD